MTDTSSPDGWQLQVDRYIAGECTSVEAMAVRGWMAADPARRALVEELVRRHRSGAPAVAPSPDPRAVAQAFDVLERRIARTTPRTTLRTTPRTTLRTTRRVGVFPDRIARPLAAAVVVALGTGLVVRSMSRHTALAAAEREYATGAGQRLSVTLIDGTQLTLAPASRVRLAAGYGAGAAARGSTGHPSGAREVELEGEAYFAVVHDATHPFSVRTPRALIHDVGTTFVVRAYAGDGDERVVVSEGEVRLNGASLRRNDLASVDSAGRIRVRHGVSVASYVAWTQGRLVFEDTPLRDAARELERVFDVRVTVADSALGTELITAAFGDESVDEVLDVVTRTISARYERTGRAVVIRRRRVSGERLGAPLQVPLSTAQATAHVDGPRP